MGKIYSMDMRERVVRDAARGQSVRAVGRRFEVSASSVVRWTGLSRATGSAGPRRQGRPLGGGTLAAHLAFLKASVDAVPDITMPELVVLLEAHCGVRFNPASVSRVLCKAGYSYKKTVDGQRMRTRGRGEPTAGLGQTAAARHQKVSGAGGVYR